MRTAGNSIELEGGQTLHGGEFMVPGDISSAAFWVAAAAAIPGSDVEIRNVGLNPTRTALLDVMRRGGAGIEQSSNAKPAASHRAACVFGTGRLVR